MQVDFYCLAEDTEHARLLLACRLIAKGYEQKRKIHIHCASEAEAYRLDELLWTFNDESFIPHTFIGDGPAMPPPVRLGYGDLKPESRDVLINLSTDIPEWHKQFQRILELVSNNAAQKELSREHYRRYKELGYALKSHQMGNVVA